MTFPAMRLALAILMLVSCAVHLGAVDPAELDRMLATTGLAGEMHGVIADSNLFAFTYRNPRDFFDFVQISLVARDPAVIRQLTALGRHDRVRVNGSFVPNPSGQRHLLVTSVELLQEFAPPMAVPVFEREASLPRDLMNKSKERFLVHIADSGSGVLVVEYQDAVVPVFVQNKALLQGLFRGDVVELKFAVQPYPQAPAHLNLRESEPDPLKVVDSIREKHGKPASMEGDLVLFPRSPQIRFNVFALLETLPDNLSRQYTLTNLEDDAVFTKIREKLQAAWDRHQAAGDYENGRNKLVSRKVRVRVTGVFSQTDAGQANPQILIASPDDIQIRD